MTLKTIAELTTADTTTSVVRGASITKYALQPTLWLNTVIEAAKQKHLYAQFAYQTSTPEGHSDVVIPKIDIMLGSGDYAVSQSEGADILYTSLSNYSGVQITPTDYNYGFELSNKAIRTSAVDILKGAREQLTWYAGDLVDRAVVTAYAGATAATSSARGAQTVYGGDATSDNGLTAGDILTTSMITEAKRKLETDVCKYWTVGTSEASSSAVKNPWQNTKDDPFVLFIAPEQQEALLNDTQFVNASEYGSDKIVHSGEIGEYLGIKVVVSVNTKSVAISGTAPDGGSAPSVAMNRCIMAKPKKAVALAWGQKPKLYSFDYPSQLAKRIILELAYAADQLQDDAIVWLDVAKE
jgi:N4-gp56 family major capsid protein